MNGQETLSYVILALISMTGVQGAYRFLKIPFLILHFDIIYQIQDLLYMPDYKLTPLVQQGCLGN